MRRNVTSVRKYDMVLDAHASTERNKTLGRRQWTRATRRYDTVI